MIATPEASTALLRALLPPGATVYCVLRRSTRAGNPRAVSLFAIERGELRPLDWTVAVALDLRLDERNGGIRVAGDDLTDVCEVLIRGLSATLYSGNPGALRHSWM